jgi:hypothetical protein
MTPTEIATFSSGLLALANSSPVLGFTSVRSLVRVQSRLLFPLSMQISLHVKYSYQRCDERSRRSPTVHVPLDVNHAPR